MNGNAGTVILLGAGPGDPGLMTLRGKEALDLADVVVYDRLVSQEILEMIPERAVTIYAGKGSGNHSIPQEEINALLLRYVREGKCVVRLKGGDPYVFGRGAEELSAIIAENIPVEVIPGLSSALAVPAYAGIPVSHRDFASSVHIITAHRKNGLPPAIDYASLVTTGGTLVFLMGLGTLDTITQGLLKAGMNGAMPAALVENGTRPDQRKLMSTVAAIAAQAQSQNFHPPATLIVGSVCTLSDKLDWFSRLPLTGVTVIVTGKKTETSLSQGLRKLGANVLRFACISIEALPVPDSVFNDIATYNWVVFTSPTGAELFFDNLRERNMDIRSLHNAGFAAVGEKTAAVIAARGIRVDFVPQTYNARCLAETLPPHGGQNVLVFRAEEGSPEVVKTLSAQGFSVTDIAAYRTIRETSCPQAITAKIEQGAVNFVAFTSASGVQGFAASLADTDISGITAICIGKETASVARNHFRAVIISEKVTTESMIEKIRREITVAL